VFHQGFLIVRADV